MTRPSTLRGDSRQNVYLHARRWRYVVAGVLTEERAEALAERLRAELPNDVDVSVEPNLSDLRLPTFQFLLF